MYVPRDSSDNGGIDFAEHPYKWVAIPIGLVLIGSLVVTFMRYRKRERQRHYMMNAFQRELDAIGPRQDGQSASNRGWPWAAERPRNSRRAGTGVGRREEGLNELGEAPPAYSAPIKDIDEVELQDMAPSPVASHANAPLSQAAQHTTGSDGTTPPSYAEGQQSRDTSGHPRDATGSQYPATPAPAVLPSR